MGGEQCHRTLFPFSFEAIHRNQPKRHLYRWPASIDVELPDKQVVGIIDICNFEAFHNRAEVGIVIDESYRNQGLGSLSLSILIEHCFQYLGIRQLYAYIDVTNEPCLRLFEKAGFEKCAYLKDWMRTGKTYRDVVMVQLLNR